MTRRITARLASAALVGVLVLSSTMIATAPPAIAQPQHTHTDEKFGDFLKRMIGKLSHDEPQQVQRKRYVPRHAPAVSLVPAPKPNWLSDTDYSSHWEGLTAVNASRAEFFRAQPNSRVGRLRTYYLEYLAYERFMAEQPERDAYRAVLEAAKAYDPWAGGTSSPELGNELRLKRVRLEQIDGQLDTLDATIGGLLASGNVTGASIENAAGAVEILHETLNSEREAVFTEIDELRDRRAVAIAAETFVTPDALQSELDQIALSEAAARDVLRQALKLAAGPSQVPSGDALDAFNRLLKEKLGTDDLALSGLRDISGVPGEDAEPPLLIDDTAELAAALYN